MKINKRLMRQKNAKIKQKSLHTHSKKVCVSPLFLGMGPATADVPSDTPLDSNGFSLGQQIYYK